ncbi:hypothetical protein EDD85DRAFT_955234 [Armillaria nabsnona]|nr:hypothetical protein EDD85DRAFT_955234 [Armillaria nabsnona]
MKKDQATPPSPPSPTDIFAKLSLTSPTLRRFDNVFIDLRFACRLRQAERFKGPSVHFPSTATKLSPPGASGAPFAAAKSRIGLLVFNVGSHALKIAAHDHFYGLKVASVGDTGVIRSHLLSLCDDRHHCFPQGLGGMAASTGVELDPEWVRSSHLHEMSVASNYRCRLQSHLLDVLGTRFERVLRIGIVIAVGHCLVRCIDELDVGKSVLFSSFSSGCFKQGFKVALTRDKKLRGGGLARAKYLKSFSVEQLSPVLSPSSSILLHLAKLGHHDPWIFTMPGALC